MSAYAPLIPKIRRRIQQKLDITEVIALIKGWLTTIRKPCACPDMRKASFPSGIFGARYLALITVLLLLSACIATRNEYRHRSFNYHSVQKEGIAVIGMASADKPSKPYLYLSWSKSLEKSIRNKRQLYPLVSAIDSRKALAGNYTAVLDGFQKNNELSPGELQLVKQAPIAARYALFARIERNQLDRPPYQEIPMRNSHGETLSDRSRVILTSRRIVTVSAKVYDLRSGRIVWQKVREAAPENNASYVVYRGDSFAGALTTATLNTVHNGVLSKKPPKFPDFHFALDKVLNNIADQLPDLS